MIRSCTAGASPRLRNNEERMIRSCTAGASPELRNNEERTGKGTK